MYSVGESSLVPRRNYDDCIANLVRVRALLTSGESGCRSVVYQPRSLLQENYFAAFFKIYAIDTLLHQSNSNASEFRWDPLGAFDGGGFVPEHFARTPQARGLPERAEGVHGCAHVEQREREGKVTGVRLDG